MGSASYVASLVGTLGADPIFPGEEAAISEPAESGVSDGSPSSVGLRSTEALRDEFGAPTESAGSFGHLGVVCTFVSHLP